MYFYRTLARLAIMHGVYQGFFLLEGHIGANTDFVG